MTNTPQHETPSLFPMAQRTPKDVYDFYKIRVYRLWNIRDRKRHNDYLAEQLSTATSWQPYYGWSSWHKIDARFHREYNKSMHKQHIAEGRNGAYLWCDACMKTKHK